MEKINYAYSQEVYELAYILIKETYTKDVAEVGKDLLYNSISTIPEIQSRLKLSFEAVKNCLIILTQSRLLISHPNFKKETNLVGYEIDIESTLNILLFPRILLYVKDRFGEYAITICEELIKFGLLTYTELFGQVLNILEHEGKKINDLIISRVKNTFLNMVESNFLIQSKKIEHENKTPSFNKIIKTNSQRSKKKQIETPKKTNQNSKKSQRSNKKKNIIEEEEIKEDLHMDEIIDEDKKDSKEDIDNPILYDKETESFYAFHFNYSQILVNIKVETIINYINQKMSTQAGLVASSLLEKNPQNSFRIGKTENITFAQITKKFPSFQQDPGKYLLDQNEFFSQHTSDSVYLNLEKIGRSLKEKILEKYIVQKFSENHLRIFRLLHLCGALDSKNIMDICLIPPKQCNMVLNQLYGDSIVEIQNLTIKSNNINFYSVNFSNCIMNVINNCFKMILNIKEHFNETKEKLKISPNAEEMMEEYINKMSFALNQLYESIIILKYC
ncbi:MAG: hypothetical protein MJ252_12765 [archaeon]|nr:hypothetical protein [archaeon]